MRGQGWPKVMNSAQRGGLDLFNGLCVAKIRCECPLRIACGPMEQSARPGTGNLERLVSQPVKTSAPRRFRALSTRLKTLCLIFPIGFTCSRNRVAIPVKHDPI